MTRDKLLRGLLFFYALSLLVALGSLVSPTRFRGLKASKVQPGSVAVVHILGPIHTNLTSSSWSADADDIAARLHRLGDSDDVKAILLRINSPGGNVGAVQEIYSEVLKCKTKGKKVVASLGDVAASGGYYIASAADLVVANPGTITGSIGVLMELGNLEGLLQKIGVRLEVIKKGQHKDIGSPARPITEEERRLLQASIDDAYAQFVDAVVQGRRMPHEKVIALADGRVFTGRQALQAGLVDELGNNQDALDSAIRLAHLSPNAAVLSDAPHSILEFLKNFSAFSGVGALKSLADQSFGAGLQYILQ